MLQRIRLKKKKVKLSASLTVETFSEQKCFYNSQANAAIMLRISCTILQNRACMASGNGTATGKVYVNGILIAPFIYLLSRYSHRQYNGITFRIC